MSGAHHRRNGSGPTPPGLVMLCDVDIGFPDATRTHTVEVAKGFARAGFAVDLVARGPDPGADGVHYCRADGAELQRLRRLATLNLHTVKLLWARRRTARRFYVRDNWSCFPALLVAKALGYRVVVQVDGIPYGPGFESDLPAAANHIKRGVAIATGRISNGMLAVTPQIKRILVDVAKVPSDRIAVIPNGVDLQVFAPQSREAAIARTGLDPACRYVAFCGGFHLWTDFETMLASFAQVAASRPDARLLLVGDGPARELIEDQVRRLQLADRVVMTGLVHDRERVRDYLSAATLTLLIYRSDKLGRTSASPIKLTEYLAAARAVVAVDIPGVREILEDHGAGIVVRGDVDEIARAIADLLDPQRADELGAAGRRYAEERLSWQSVVHRTLPLFEQ
jgi:glycosyltransferase involved in cell wall biosynthesis